jgi:hypothetical protein
VKRIYTDEVLANVINVQNVLRINGIKSTIKNQYFELGLAGMESCPELYVEDKDVKIALKYSKRCDKEIYETRNAKKASPSTA